MSKQLALQSLIVHSLRLAKSSPHNLKIVMSNGNIMPWELAPVYDASATLVQPDRVPFRLTPNLVNFVTPVGITGLFSSAMLASAQAIADPEMHVDHLLGGIFKDELVSWSAGAPGTLKTDVKNGWLVQAVDRNVAVVKTNLEFVSSFSGSHGAVDSLIKSATASSNLCVMPANWQPWL